MNIREHGIGASGSKINGIVSDYLVAAGQTISIGDFVDFINNYSEASKDRKIVGMKTSPFVIFNPTTYIQCVATELSATSAIAVFAGTNSYTTTVVLNIEGNAITVGTPLVLYAQGFAGFSVTRLSDTKALVGYLGDGVCGYVATLTVNGNTITMGTPVAISSFVTMNINVAALSETKVLITYKADTIYDRIKGRILTITGTTVSMGAENPYIVMVKAVQSSNVVVTVVNPTTVCMAYQNNVSYCTAVVVTISGDTITAGSPATIDSNTSFTNISIITLSDNRIIIIYITGGVGKLLLLGISGTSLINYGTATLPSANLNGFVILKISPTLVLFFYRNSDGLSEVTFFNVSDVAITAELRYTLGDVNIMYPILRLLTESKILLIYRDPSNNSYTGAKVLDMVKSIQGIAKTSGIARQTIKVYIPQGG